MGETTVVRAKYFGGFTYGRILFSNSVGRRIFGGCRWEFDVAQRQGLHTGFCRHRREAGKQGIPGRDDRGKGTEIRSMRMRSGVLQNRRPLG